MRIDIMTLFPDSVDAMLNVSILGRAQQRGYISIQSHQIRQYTTNRQMQVDDYPYGGGFWDVMDLAAGPVIASHSNCRALCDVRRNLSDDQLRRIRDTGGVVGLNAFHGFVHAEPRQQTARTLALHAVHMAEVMGVEHVGCGFDFCEFMGPGNEGAEGLESAAHIRNLFYWLEKLGMNRQELEMVARGNFLRVLAGPDLPPQ